MITAVMTGLPPERYLVRVLIGHRSPRGRTTHPGGLVRDGAKPHRIGCTQGSGLELTETTICPCERCASGIFSKYRRIPILHCRPYKNIENDACMGPR